MLWAGNTRDGGLSAARGNAGVYKHPVEFRPVKSREGCHDFPFSPRDGCLPNPYHNGDGT